MKIEVTLRRSEQWVQAQRLERGENVPKDSPRAVEVAELTEEARRLLLSVWDTYQDCCHIQFGRDYMPSTYITYGYEYFELDSEDPTPDQISVAIVAAFARLAVQREKYERETAEEKAAEEREAAEKATMEGAQRAAREVLGEEIKAITGDRDEALKDVHILASFLSQVPQDALRGTLKAAVKTGEPDAIEALQERVEYAAPGGVDIFTDYYEEENEDN